MKLQKTTLILLMLALGLTGLVYLYEFRNREIEETIQENKRQVFSFKKEEIKAIDIKIHDNYLKFETTGNEDNKWEMKAPEISNASDAALSYLINLLVKGQSDSPVGQAFGYRIFSITPNELEEYGLEKPLATVTITLNNQQVHQLVLGKTDFEDKLIYTLVDPDKSNQQEIEVWLLPKDFQYAVDRELNEWKGQ